MTAKSWVETTLPPGYVAKRIFYGHGYTYGFCAGAVMRDGWLSKADRNRAAWRHWTAAVLRGRDVRWNVWGHNEREACLYSLPAAWCDSTNGCITTGATDYHSGACMRMSHVDIDEAMARFAALVLATQGPR